MANIAPLFTWRKTLHDARSPLSANARHLGLYISTFADEYGRAWPGVERCAREMGRGIRTIQRGLRELEACGYVWIERRTGHSNVYHLTMPAWAVADLLESVSYPQAREGDTGDSPPNGGPVTVAPHPRQGDTQNSLENSPKNPGDGKKPKGDHRALFGALCEVMGRPPQGGEGAVWGRVAKLMAQELVPPAEVVRRGAAMKARWTTIPPSPMALWNNWGQFAEGQREVSPYERRAQGERDIHELAEDLRRRGEA